MATLYAPRIITDGLVLALDAANVKSYPGTGTIWSDLSGNGYSGSLVGATTFSHSPAKFDTNATSVTEENYLSVTPTINFEDASEYTLEFFVKLRSNAQSTFQSLTGRNSTNPWISLFPTNTSGAEWNIRYRQSGGTYINSSNIGYNLQLNWGLISLTVDSSRNVNIYLNGIFNQTITPTTTLFIINRVAGGYVAGDNYYVLQGSMASCRIYNKTLTAQEVLQNYNATKRRFGL